MTQADPVLPPLFTGHAVNAPQTAFDAACRGAMLGHFGAADLVWSRNTARVDLALVLEPEVRLSRACQMAALGYVALAEALGHVGPPQMPVEFRWPGTVLVNGARCGEIRLAAPSADRDAVPPWLVLGVSLTRTSHHFKGEPGAHLDETALDLEGAGDVTRTALIETLARCLLAWLHTWNTSGFRQIADHWLFSAEGRDRDIELAGMTGRVLGLDEDGGVVLKRVDGKVTILPYLPEIVASM